MKITVELNAVGYHIKNKGRVIATFDSYQEYDDARMRLRLLAGQLTRPEGFCNCKDIGCDRQQLR